MIYQEISLNRSCPCREHLPGQAAAGACPGSSTGSGPTPGREALAQVGLEVGTTQAVRLLSTSQQQMISIAKALYRRRASWCWTSPPRRSRPGNRDPDAHSAQPARQGISCIYISHKLDEVFNIADRITVLRDGSVISTTPREEVVPRVCGGHGGAQDRDDVPQGPASGAGRSCGWRLTVPSRIPAGTSSRT